MLLDAHDSVDLPTFLSEYWQKKPLLIRNALPGFTDFLSPEELAGLACEEDVESRLVFNNAGNWEMKNGPFSERDFTFLSESHWTLLVQSVDHWLPEVKSLLQEVTFIPAWRLDDVMVSYAARDGGVGPHFDYYDVFLLQGQGSRRWQIGPTCDSSTRVDTSSGLKILETFSAEEEVELNTGDALYIPAGLSHQGSAVEAGLSYSIGFRAPAVAEMLDAFSFVAAEALPADLRYRDPALTSTRQPGEIGADALQQVKALMQHALDDDGLLAQSFGRLMTEPRLLGLLDPPEEETTPQQLVVILQKGGVLSRHPVVRFACHRAGDTLHFFVNGECLSLCPVSDKLAALNGELQDAVGRPLDLAPYKHNRECLELLALLYNQGCLVRTESHEQT